MRLIVGLFVSTILLSAADPDSIRKVLADQVDAWNRGDINAFVSSYEDSPSITFVGKTVSRGYKGVLDRYRRNYPDQLHMGTLRFDEIEVRMLGKDYALVIGKFILTRQEAGGGPASGRWTLIARRTGDGWKFIHDHTSN